MRGFILPSVLSLALVANIRKSPLPPNRFPSCVLILEKALGFSRRIFSSRNVEPSVPAERIRRLVVTVCGGSISGSWVSIRFPHYRAYASHSERYNLRYRQLPRCTARRSAPHIGT